MVHGLEVEPMVRPSGGAMVKQNERFCVWHFAPGARGVVFVLAHVTKS